MLAALIISINTIKALAEQGYLKVWFELKPADKIEVHTK